MTVTLDIDLTEGWRITEVTGRRGSPLALITLQGTAPDARTVMTRLDLDKGMLIDPIDIDRFPFTARAYAHCPATCDVIRAALDRGP